MNGVFPAPQTLGRQRDLNTVAADPNAGLLVRPVQTEGQSLFNQAASYVNNWLGNISIANQEKDVESLNKAGKVSSQLPQSFPTLVDTAGQTPSPFQTMADAFMDEIGLKVSSVEPAASVAGRPVAPQTTNYQYANNIDKALAAGGAWVGEQVKGFFNITYEGPVEPTAAAAGPPPPIGQTGPAVDGSTVLIILGILYLVTA